jgi:TPR repeat protein
VPTKEYEQNRLLHYGHTADGDVPVSAARSSPFSLIVALALLLLTVCLATQIYAEFEAGLEAYSRGDYTTALREWRPVAERGHADAQYHLGMLYDFRKGVPQDFAMAREWYEKAASQGHAGAQTNLGGLYEFGHGVTRNYVLAYMWYHLAAQSTDDTWRDTAAENRDEIAENMTFVQIAEAKKRAREWRPKTQ